MFIFFFILHVLLALFEPHHDKNLISCMQTTKVRTSLLICAVNQHLYFLLLELESKIAELATCKNSSLSLCLFLGHYLVAPGRVAQSVTCLATDANLTADPGVVSSIPAQSHTSWRLIVK